MDFAVPSPKASSKKRRAPTSEVSVTINELPSEEEDSFQDLKQSKKERTAGVNQPEAQTMIGFVSLQSEIALDAFEEQLTCGMCAAVFINPVALEGCGHVYCGGCLKDWISAMQVAAERTDTPRPAFACPNCRKTPLTKAYPSHLVAAMCEVLLKYRPALVRPLVEILKIQGCYTVGTLITFPAAATAGYVSYPAATARVLYWHPCPSCTPDPDDPDAFTCPLPVLPNTFPSDSICPEGHRLCAGCEELSPLAGPSAKQCDVCREGFCGMGASVCECAVASEAKPCYEYDEELVDMLQSGEDLDLETAFADNGTEMENAAIYISLYDKTPKSVYLDILKWAISDEGMAAGGIPTMLSKLVGVSGRANVDLDLVILIDESRICGGCVSAIIAMGLPGWLARELRAPGEDMTLGIGRMRARERCKYGSTCPRQQAEAHTKKYTHLYPPLPADVRANLVQDDDGVNYSDDEDDGDQDEDEEEGMTATDERRALEEADAREQNKASPDVFDPTSSHATGTDPVAAVADNAVMAVATHPELVNHLSTELSAAVAAATAPDTSPPEVPSSPGASSEASTPSSFVDFDTVDTDPNQRPIPDCFNPTPTPSPETGAEQLA